MATVTLTGTVATSSGAGIAWSNTAGFYGTSSASAAAVSIASTGSSQILEANTFPTNQVPTGATINGILITANVWGSTTGATITSFTATINSITSTNADSGATIGTLDTGTVTLGSSSTIPAGLTGVTVADINTGRIAIDLQVQYSGAGSNTISAYNSSVQVTYTAAANSDVPVTVTIPAAFCWWLHD